MKEVQIWRKLFVFVCVAFCYTYLGPYLVRVISQPNKSKLENPDPRASPGWKEMSYYVGTLEELPRKSPWMYIGSQCGQDKVIMKLFNYKKDGYFLDLAANSAVKASNTFFLDVDYGWRGVCVEANPMYLQPHGLLLRACSVVSAVVGRKDNEIVQFNLDKNGDSGIVGENTRNQLPSPGVLNFSTVTLDNILRHVNAPKVIDYFSFDIEGAEEMVMESFSWQYTFLAMTIEGWTEKLHLELTAHGYRYINDKDVNFTCNFDRLYVHESFPDLENAIVRIKK